MSARPAKRRGRSAAASGDVLLLLNDDAGVHADAEVERRVGPEIAHAGARVGDALIMTKPIGSGVLFNANLKGWVSKAALDACVRYAAYELGPRGVRVNVVAPGLIESDMTAAQDEKRREAYTRQILLGRHS